MATTNSVAFRIQSVDLICSMGMQNSISSKNVKKMPYRAVGQGQLNATFILLKILCDGKLSSQKQSLEQKMPYRAAGQEQLNAINIL